ncbi:hypothetical protein LJC22_00565 [Desulfosarcina sp. OttesenSCG-928-G10]|nr:hypothetical protein [Desulfosarcina sp. OttesenSCG-928-G10]MDL2320910.1 hypothetical protein [Desulfosarcina sp. OttesenSCG-928-B08]
MLALCLFLILTIQIFFIPARYTCCILVIVWWCLASGVIGGETATFNSMVFIYCVVSGIKLFNVVITEMSYLPQNEDRPSNTDIHKKQEKAEKIFFFVCLPILVFSYSCFVSHSVWNNARKIAGDDPFCIIVTKRYDSGRFGSHRIIADSFFDTMGINMMGGKWGRHAVLVVGCRENYLRYHWSYIANTFLPSMQIDADAACLPSES